MSFRDYSSNPNNNTALADGTYIGPNMLRNKVRPALQQLAADGRTLYDAYAALSYSGIQYRGTYAEGIAEFSVGEYFMTDESGVLRVYKRISTAPYYEDQGDTAAPLGPGELASDAGAGMVGYSPTYPSYSANTVGAKLKEISTQDLGALSSGVTENLLITTDISGAADGTTDYRRHTDIVDVNGSNNVQQVIGHHIQMHHYGLAGNITFLECMRGHIRVNLAASPTLAGTVTAARCMDMHIALEGPGSITDSFVYYAGDVDLIDGAGLITNQVGYRCNNQGHATRISGRATGFECGDFTAGAPLTAAFYSAMGSGTNKYTIYTAGSAPSVHAGKVRIGSTAAPTDVLEVQGFLKAASNGAFVTAGSYHELQQANSAVVANFSNAHASTPSGINVSFTGAAPNNTTQIFMRCQDNVTSRLIVYSNGNVVNTLNSYGAISDAREKTDIIDASEQLTDIRALRVRKFRLKSDPGLLQIGLVAQEAERVSPGLVFDTMVGKNMRKGVNYSVLYMKAIKALQELADIVDRQGKEIDALKAKRA